MAKRRSSQQIKTDQIIKKNLNVLGEKIYRKARRITRVQTGRLKGSINYRVKPDTVLTFTQVGYGADVRPSGVNSGETDALLITIKEMIPEGIEIIKKDLIESILYPFRG